MKKTPVRLVLESLEAGQMVQFEHTRECRKVDCLLTKAVDRVRDSLAFDATLTLISAHLPNGKVGVACFRV
jgi:hypothetical protein